jgi:hypothetical protein
MRARGIKPGVFKNEALAEIAPPWGRLLFMGLWGLADREGRLLDRPGHIAVEIFPYDLAQTRLSIKDVEAMLDKLAQGSAPFILRYKVGAQKIIQVVNFRKHQAPHHTEKASELPEYPLVRKKKGRRKITVGSPLDNGEFTVGSPLDNGGNPPDTGLLTEDTQTPDSGQPAISCQGLAALWNAMAPPELSKVSLPFKRPSKDMADINDVLGRHPDRVWWKQVMSKICESPFLRGANKRKWQASIDFMLANAETIHDGKYEEGLGQMPEALRGLQDYAHRRHRPLVVVKPVD